MTSETDPEPAALAGRLRAGVAAAVVVTAGAGVTACGSLHAAPAKTPRAVVTTTATVPVDYGDASVSVPSDWYFDYADGVVAGSTCLVGRAPGTIYVGAGGPGIPAVTCARDPSMPIVQLGPISRRRPPVVFHTAVVNGLSVQESIDVSGRSYFRVPELGVALTAQGPGAATIIDSLGRMPGLDSLAAGPPPAVPRSWKWLTEDGIRFAVPGRWPTATTSKVARGCGPGQGPAISPSDGVLVDSDQGMVVGTCPYTPPGTPLFEPVEAPADGVVLNVGHAYGPSQGAWLPPAGAHGPCLHLGRLTACLYGRSPTSGDGPAAFDSLFVLLTIPGHPAPELMQIGIAGNGVVARTILHSLRAA